MRDCLHVSTPLVPAIFYMVTWAVSHIAMILCRYFNVPFLMVLLHMKPVSRFQAGVTAGLFVLADALTVYIFLLRPFRWHDGSIARFMF